MNQKLAAILARTTRLPKGAWFKDLPDEAQKAWQQIESELDRAGADYIEQDDQRGGAVLLVQEPRHLRGIALHVFAPSDVTHYERKLHRDVSVAPAKLTVWNQRGDNTELSLRQWKKAVSLVKKALGQKVEEPHGLTHLWRYAFSAADRRAVVVALIKANRRDLAYVVAGKWPSLTVKTILKALKAKRVASTVLDAVAELAAGGGLTREQLEGVLKRFTGTLAKDAKRVADTFGLYEGMMLGMDVNPMRLETARVTRQRRTSIAPFNGTHPRPSATCR